MVDERDDAPDPEPWRPFGNGMPSPPPPPVQDPYFEDPYHPDPYR